MNKIEYKREIINNLTVLCKNDEAEWIADTCDEHFRMVSSKRIEKSLHSMITNSLTAKQQFLLEISRNKKKWVEMANSKKKWYQFWK